MPQKSSNGNGIQTFRLVEVRQSSRGSSASRPNEIRNSEGKKKHPVEVNRRSVSTCNMWWVADSALPGSTLPVHMSFGRGSVTKYLQDDWVAWWHVFGLLELTGTPGTNSSTTKTAATPNNSEDTPVFSGYSGSGGGLANACLLPLGPWERPLYLRSSDCISLPNSLKTLVQKWHQRVEQLSTATPGTNSRKLSESPI